MPMLLLYIATMLVGVTAQIATTMPRTTTLQQAQMAQASGNLRASAGFYKQILHADPADTQAQAGLAEVTEELARAAHAAGEDAESLSDLLSAASYAPRDPRLLYDTASLEDSMRLYWDAGATVTRLQALPGSDQPAVLYLAARIRMDLGQLAAAAQLMRAYLKARPDDATAHYGLGRMLQLQEDFPQAKLQFQASLALAPHQTESQFELGEIALAQGAYAQAIDEYAQTVAGNPTHAGALAGTGIAGFHLQEYEKAAAALRQAIAAQPDYQPAHYYLGLTLARQGQKDEAMQQLAEATSLAQKQAQADAQRLHLEQGAPH